MLLLFSMGLLSFLSLPVSLLPHKLLTCWFIPGKPYSEFGRVHKDLGYVSQTWVMCERKWKLLSHVQLFATPWTTVHGILQARILEWVAFPSSRGSSQPRDRTWISCVSYISGGFFTCWAIREVQGDQTRERGVDATHRMLTRHSAYIVSKLKYWR